MKQIIWMLTISLLALTVHGRAAAQANDDLSVQINNRENYGGIERFTLSNNDKRLMEGLFTFVGNNRNGWQVIRDQDERQQKCMQEADAGWFRNFKKLENPSEMLPVAIGKTKWNDVRNCNTEWHKRIVDAMASRKAAIESIQLRARDKTVRNQVAEILQRTKGIEVAINDEEGPIGSLQSQMKALGDSNRELSELLRSKIGDSEKKEKAEQLKADIDTGAQFMQLLGKVAFANNPQTAYRITVASNGIATISQNIIDLGSGPKLGQKILAGLNITNGALSMISMFSAFGGDPTAAMIQQGFSGIHNDIKNLAGAMNDRFDRVESGMSILYTNMNNRFERLDEQFKLLNAELVGLSTQVRNYYGITSQGLAAILSQPYFVAYTRCTESNAETTLSLDALTNCQAQIKVFAVNSATDQSLTGEALFDPRLPPEEAANDVESRDPQYRLGYLKSSLMNGLGQPGRGSAALSTRVPSPYVWANVTDAHLSLFQLAPKLREDPISSETLIKASQNQLNALAQTGKAILATEHALRTEGVARAVKIYRNRLKEVSTALATTALSEVSDRKLGIENESDYREVILGNYTNSLLKVELRRGTKLTVKDGPQRGRDIIVTSYRRRVFPPMLIPANASAYMDSVKREATEDWLHDDRPDRYGLNTYDPLVNASSEEIHSALRTAAEEYFKAVKVADMNTTAQRESTDIGSWLSQPATDNELAKACLALSSARLYVMQLAMFGRTTTHQAGPWVNALAELPGGGEKASGQECKEVISFLAKAPVPQGLDRGITLKDYYRDWFESAIRQKLINFVRAYKSAEQNVSDPSIETRLLAIGAYTR